MTKTTGEDLPQSVLTEAQIRHLRRVCKPYSRTHSVAAFARLWGVHYRTIRKALKGDTWKHVK